MVDKFLRPSASRKANGTEKDRRRSKISERPVAPEPPSPYSNENETNNTLNGNTVPHREPRSRLELLEEALQERPRPQRSTKRREELAKDSFEDIDDHSFDSSPPPADNEDWEQVPDDMSALPVSHLQESLLLYVFFSAFLLITAPVASRAIVPLPWHLACRAFRHL